MDLSQPDMIRLGPLERMKDAHQSAVLFEQYRESKESLFNNNQQQEENSSHNRVEQQLLD